LPVDTGDGVPVFLLGSRDSPADPFRYLRIPADDQNSLDGFLRLRAALQNPTLRELAVRRYATRAVDKARPELVTQLMSSANRAMSLFAGTEVVKGNRNGGLQAVADFMELNVPEADRNRASEVLIRILNGVLYELLQVSREQAKLPALIPDDKLQGFMTQSVFALSDVPLYPAPMMFQLQDFTQVQASVFQVARAPGKTVVYLGCALLILGVFAMLYVRERRLWIWFAPHGPDETPPQTQATMALSTNRKTMDGDREFVQLKDKLLGIKDLST